MNYLLILITMNFPAQQIGPFKTDLACESAAAQIEHVVRTAAYRAKTVCVGIDTKPVHWKGKALPK